MNIQSKPTLTPAEQGLIDAFVAKVSDLPGDAELTAHRDRLIAQLTETGLPSRRIEAWHYTDLRTLLKSVPGPQPAGAADALPPIAPNALILPLLQGTHVQPAAADGLTCTSLQERLLAGGASETLQPLGRDDAIGMINSAFVTDGYVMSLDSEAELAPILELQAVQDGGQAHGRFEFEANAASRATILERHARSGDSAGLTSSVSVLKLAENADLTWIILQDRGADDVHLGQLRAELAEGARLRLFVINTGGHLVRQEVVVKVEGEGAHFDLRAINLLAGQGHTDVTLSIDHSAPHTTSEEVVRNVVLDRARGVFQGQIRVAREAQKTDAQMACNTLLLTDEGEFDAKPELEIFADDVICAHGATVIDLDPAHLFYLTARGISEKVARQLLINGFVDELLDELDNEELADVLKRRVEDWLDRHV
ncbi:Fe-S cluster assembly protein SufD [Pseudohoeflea coraliihabitans]|uniref:Fe-S cluster assembly protein SufD n=1 Tax=Pseudohoeflea coraliihabitans TaxID=2860393 RepID=A0ABS6WSH4_9HYPH|nr:Fe-S cluster assembly protein SufD [Pseudohoeflea sp. DP4N28-3]MBW3098890.1 Fe-S cluster assembly protein SufD [Pseudohoeflea sp. DP4N28-3]